MADSIVRLKVESQEYDTKLRRAAEGLTRYADECRRVGGTLEVVEKDTLDYVRALGQMDTVSRSATGKLSEMKRTFTELSVQYKQLTDEEKNSPFGQTLSRSLDQLKGRITDAKTQLDEVNREMGTAQGEALSLRDVIGQLGSQFGISSDLTGMLTSGTIAYTAAIGAAASAVGVAAKEWAAYNEELARQSQITTVTTGLKGDDAEDMTIAMRALAKTYNVDFREAVNAANTLMSQFGMSGDAAIQLIRDGMQGMILGDGPKLLNMIQQYAPSFRDAGISASQLVAIIQNSEGGIFTDQNMNAIVMGIKNIRLMTGATSDALAQMGIDGEEMTRKLNDGSMSVFDALKQVAEAVDGTNSSSQAAGEVMQAVFGRQGAMAGTKLGEAIATLNTNLEETKRQTEDVGRAYSDLQRANEQLERAIKDCFGYNGWDEMATNIKANLLTALADVLDVCSSIHSVLDDIGYIDAFGKVTSAILKTLSPFVKLLGYAREFFGLLSSSPSPKGGAAAGANAGAAAFGNLPSGNRPRSNTTNTTEPAADSITAQQKEVQRLTDLWQNASSEMRDGYLKQLEKAQATLDKMMGKTSSSSAGHKKETEVFAPDSIVAQQKEVQRLTGLWQRAGGEMRDGYLKQLEEAKFQLEQLNGKNVPRPWGGFAVGVGPAATSPGIADERIKIQAELDAENMKIDKETLRTVLTDAVQNGIDLMDLQFGEINAKIQNGVSIPDETWQRIIDQYNRLREQMGMDPITIDITTGKTGKQKESNNSGKNKKNSNPFLHTDDDGKQTAKVNELLGGMQAVSTILSSILTIVSVIQAIAAADAIIPFARGGIVGRAASGMLVGTHLSGDNLRMPVVGGGMVGVNDGELILNRAQQGNLASQFDGNGFGSLSLETVLRGEDIRIVLNNNGRRTGYGEFVQSRKRS